MARHFFTDANYDNVIWEKAWKAITAELSGKNYSTTVIIEELSQRVNLSESTLWRSYNGTDENRWSPTTRKKLLNYIGFDTFETFKTEQEPDIKVSDTYENLERPSTPTFNNQHHFNIPIRPNYFIGRKGKLEEIHAHLTSKIRRHNTLLLSSIGGMGKTTLMQEYLYQDYCRQYFNYIIAVSINKDLESSFISGADMALNVGVTEIVLREDKMKGVINKMRSCGGENLFVIDNINESDYDDLLKMKTKFNSTGWKFLITSRTAPDNFAIIQVDELDLEDAILLFAFHYAPDYVDHNDKQELNNFIVQLKIKRDIELLIKHTTGHTLLIELLAKAGKKKGISISQLLKLLKEQDFRHPNLQRIITVGSHSENTFRQELNKTTLYNYLVSIFDTEYFLKKSGETTKDKENETKMDMLRFFSVLPSEDISIIDLKMLWDVSPKKENEFEDRLDELKQIGWIQGKQELDLPLQNLTYRMHSLVQDVVYDKLKPDISSCRPLVKTITKILPVLQKYPQRYQNYAKSVVDKLNLLDKKN